MWSWLSYDYDSNVPIELILNKAQKIKGGDVLVVHDNIKSQGEYNLTDALECMIKKGVQFKSFKVNSSPETSFIL